MVTAVGLQHKLGVIDGNAITLGRSGGITVIQLESRDLRRRKRLVGRNNELATNSKNKNIRDLYRGINYFKRGYQSRINLVKDESGDLLADSHNILNRWKNYFPKLLNVHRVSDVRQIEIHTADPSVNEPSPFEINITIAKLENYKSPGSEQIPAERFKQDMKYYSM
jgi:hypothetical protein